MGRTGVSLQSSFFFFFCFPFDLWFLSAADQCDVKSQKHSALIVFLLLLIILKVFDVIKSLIKVIQALICLDDESPAVFFQSNGW